MVGYEGKKGLRKRLENRLTVAGVSDGPGIWEEASCVLGQKFCLVSPSCPKRNGLVPLKVRSGIPLPGG